MTSPEEYHQRLWDLGIMDLRIRVNSDETAKTALAQLHLVKKQLQNMKREVNADIKAIKIKYQSQMMTAGTTGGTVLRGLGLFGLRGMRGLARSYEANATRGAKYMQNIEQEPYYDLKLTICSPSWKPRRPSYSPLCSNSSNNVLQENQKVKKWF